MIGNWGAALFILLFSMPATAQDSNSPPLDPGPGQVEALPKTPKAVSFRFRSDFYSRYLWNGVPYSKGAVWQPSATLEFHGVGVTFWSNFVLGNEANQGQFNEVDITLYYRRSIGKWSLQGSLIGLVYFNDDPASLNRGPNGLQGYFQVSRPVGPVKLFSDLTIGFLEPSGTVFWDFGIGYQKDLPLHFNLETSLLFGVGDARFNKAFIADVGIQANLAVYSLAFPWRPIKGLSLIPTATFSNLLAPSLRKASPAPTVLWGGLSVVYDL
ncbi:MAG: hypothetical protein K8R69_09360 [Deltaproteobacteria bacterium]|nr:hypothetical protein [Deltaproteobacteria bacterium]